MEHDHLINVKKVFLMSINEKKSNLDFDIDCNCTGFSAPVTCSCGEPAYRHVTLVETKEERERRGHPTGYATPYKAMGGLTGFSSLAEGYLRLDPSGRGLKEEKKRLFSNLNIFLYKQVDLMMIFLINQ
jgi:hypothetical protein